MTFVRTGSCAVVRDPVYQEAIDRTVLANVKHAPPMTNELNRASALVGNSRADATFATNFEPRH